MDAEGYSGRDGRTTIFDYWSVASLRSWLNKGLCNCILNERRKQLRDFYARLLTLCNKEKALREGRFFDLMYVNYHNPGLDPHRDYAYLRSTDDDTLLIIANFSDRDKEISVTLPRHAFNTLGLPEGSVKATELLGGEKAPKNFC